MEHETSDLVSAFVSIVPESSTSDQVTHAADISADNAPGKLIK
jgi:hypothetical protein